MGEDETVDLTVRFNGVDMYHVIRRNEPFESLFLQAKDRFNCDTSLRFFYEHKEVKPESTPNDIDIGNYDIIVAKLDKSILVNLQGLTDEPASVKMPKDAKFAKILSKVCSKLGLSPSDVSFTYNRREILESKTPADYGMCAGDTIVATRRGEKAAESRRLYVTLVGVDGISRSRTVDPGKPMKVLCEKEIRNCGLDRDRVKFFLGENLIDTDRTFDEAGAVNGSVISMRMRAEPGQRVQRAVPRVYSQHPSMVSFVVRFDETKDFKISMHKDEIMGIMMKRVCETLGLNSGSVKFTVVDENGDEERPLSYQKPCDLGLNDGAYVKVSKFV